MSENETWEYLAIGFNDSTNQDAVEETLNHHGVRGWELVNILIDRGELGAFFKRPAVEVGPPVTIITVGSVDELPDIDEMFTEAEQEAMR